MAEVMNTPFGDVDTAAVEAATAAAGEKAKIEEITIKGLCSEPFTSKNGVDLVRIQIPNKDPNDHTPWAEFVLANKSVHENQFGKGLWAKIPADGHTTVSKSFLAGKDENGKNIWEKDRRSVPNRELKEMVEFYKDRGEKEHAAPSNRESAEKTEEEADRSTEGKTERRSVLKDLEVGKKELAGKKAPAKTKAKAKEAEL